MIIKKIIDLCKKNLIVRIYKTEQGQFISNGSGLYPITGLPVFDEDSFCLTYDIPKDKLRFSEESLLPVNIDISDSVEEENVCEALQLVLLYHGKKVFPLITETGIKFIDSAYISPLSDNDNMLSFYERTSLNGEKYFVIKNGMLFAEAITPYEVVNREFVQEVERLYKLCKIALENKRDKTVDGQTSVFD